MMILIEMRQAMLEDRLLKTGVDNFDDLDLVELLLSERTMQCDPYALASALIAKFGSLPNIIAAPISDLATIVDLSVEQIAVLKAVYGAATRCLKTEVIARPLSLCDTRLAHYLIARLSREKVEQLLVLFLDSDDCLISEEILSYGVPDFVLAHPRMLVKRAFDHHASGLILVHNHPSGEPAPSRGDVRMTRLIKDVLASLDIRLVDHIIIGNGQHASLFDQGFFERKTGPIRSASFEGREPQHRAPNQIVRKPLERAVIPAKTIARKTKSFTDRSNG